MGFWVDEGAHKNQIHLCNPKYWHVNIENDLWFGENQCGDI